MRHTQWGLLACATKLHVMPAADSPRLLALKSEALDGSSSASGSKAERSGTHAPACRGQYVCVWGDDGVHAVLPPSFRRTWTVSECEGRTRGERPGGVAAQSTSTVTVAEAEEQPSEARSVRP